MIWYPCLRSVRWNVQRRRILTSTCQSSRDRRVLVFISYYFIHYRSVFLATIIRFAKRIFISAKCRMTWSLWWSDVWNNRICLGSVFIIVFRRIVSVFINKWDYENELSDPDRQLICSQIPICHWFQSLMVLSTERINVLLMIFIFHIRWSDTCSFILLQIVVTDTLWLYTSFPLTLILLTLESVTAHFH